MRCALPPAATAFTLVDDSYNANPDSVRAAIDVLAELPGPRLLVLGDMGEVGSQGAALHAEAGRHAQACGIEHLFTLGELARMLPPRRSHGAQHFGHIDAAADARCAPRLPEVASVLVKGSRFMRMERVVQAHRRRPRMTRSTRRCAMLLSLAQWLQTLSPDVGLLPGVPVPDLPGGDGCA